ncbi:hypothetical protein AV530_010324 [Patagioenas fasciata monilis]|uniref:Uncharacterized protein n=1 Tax=Patagioenas fasciata monilis TaxID=372326 RepID=A0A1V4KEI2_PATFA|nr:hypothetical protein AV530_010324 [Patagioenas fasciata monilis]
MLLRLSLVSAMVSLGVHLAPCANSSLFQAFLPKGNGCFNWGWRWGQLLPVSEGLETKGQEDPMLHSQVLSQA